MPRAWIDHLVVTAPSLAAGAAYVRDALGVEPGPSGEHARMGTHNRLLRLGERVYLEVIAVNPAAPAPGRPRWFGMDDREAMRAPRLATWVARSDDIHGAAAASSLSPGKVEPMSRGMLDWLITVREDGGLPLGGLAPALIQWPEGVHPADGMSESGCSLAGLCAFHPPPETVRALLKSIGLDGGLEVAPLGAGEAPFLVAEIETPSGPRRLSGR
jgi:hypothetical protein